MRNERTVVAPPISEHAAMLSNANAQTSPPAEPAQTRFPKELPNSRGCEHERSDRPGTESFWWSVFTFFMEGFAIYGASMQAGAVPIEAVLSATKHPRSPTSHTPMAAEHEHGLWGFWVLDAKD